MLKASLATLTIPEAARNTTYCIRRGSVMGGNAQGELSPISCYPMGGAAHDFDLASIRMQTRRRLLLLYCMISITGMIATPIIRRGRRPTVGNKRNVAGQEP